MQHCLSWEANGHSASQIPCLLWNLNFRHHVHKIPLLVHLLSHIPFQGIWPSPRPCVTLRNKLVLLHWGYVILSPNSLAEDHPLSAVRDCLFNIFAATSPRISWGRFLHPQPKDAPCPSDRNSHNVEQGSIWKIFILNFAVQLYILFINYTSRFITFHKNDSSRAAKYRAHYGLQFLFETFFVVIFVFK